MPILYRWITIVQIRMFQLKFECVSYNTPNVEVIDNTALWGLNVYFCKSGECTLRIHT